MTEQDRTSQQKDEDHENRPDYFGYWMLVIAILFVALLYALTQEHNTRLGLARSANLAHPIAKTTTENSNETQN